MKNFFESFEEAVSKHDFVENHPCPNPPSFQFGTSFGRDDFQRLPPFWAGQEVDENRKMDSFETYSIFIKTSTQKSIVPSGQNKIRVFCPYRTGDLLWLGFYKYLIPSSPCFAGGSVMTVRIKSKLF